MFDSVMRSGYTLKLWTFYGRSDSVMSINDALLTFYRRDYRNRDGNYFGADPPWQIPAAATLAAAAAAV
jgi:hypothetical protein